MEKENGSGKIMNYIIKDVWCIEVEDAKEKTKYLFADFEDFAHKPDIETTEDIEDAMQFDSREEAERYRNERFFWAHPMWKITKRYGLSIVPKRVFAPEIDDNCEKQLAKKTNNAKNKSLMTREERNEKILEILKKCSHLRLSDIYYYIKNSKLYDWQLTERNLHMHGVNIDVEGYLIIKEWLEE